ncbi:hypothetical protein [Thermomonospora cellulosilytica]|uniref:Uncharacterized protein n=1 Tax=Thermomonospora cellulosilytica TaxID=1411118 RepID=A0A7W3MW84_9ACTN|nr:hypothetical protein [Thermomonospora cellulosilytica]MBA9003026.1 hypothetical protein [Thermomonospora cellulosilytica]
MIAARLDQENHPGLPVDTGSDTILLSPGEAREAVRGSGPREAVWRSAILAAQRGEPDEETSGLFALWLAQSWMSRTLSMITGRLFEDYEDIEAEFITAFLENLRTADPSRPDAGETLLKAASKSAWCLARAHARERPTGDPSVLIALDELDLYSEGGWELEFTPPPRPDRLSASLRFVATPAQLEGERLGTLAHRMGLADVVLRARRPSDDLPAGTLNLRPAGAAR